MDTDYNLEWCLHVTVYVEDVENYLEITELPFLFKYLVLDVQLDVQLVVGVKLNLYDWMVTIDQYNGFCTFLICMQNLDQHNIINIIVISASQQYLVSCQLMWKKQLPAKNRHAVFQHVSTGRTSVLQFDAVHSIILSLCPSIDILFLCSLFTWDTCWYTASLCILTDQV